MPHAIVIGANGRRHEVDFEDAEVTIEVFAGRLRSSLSREMILRLPIANGLPFSTCRATSFRQPLARLLKERTRKRQGPQLEWVSSFNRVLSRA
jgi:hypothetical protein